MSARTQAASVEAQLGAIERVGLPQYLAAQISTDAP